VGAVLRARDVAHVGLPAARVLLEQSSGVRPRAVHGTVVREERAKSVLALRRDPTRARAVSSPPIRRVAVERVDCRLASFPTTRLRGAAGGSRVARRSPVCTPTMTTVAWDRDSRPTPAAAGCRSATRRTAIAVLLAMARAPRLRHRRDHVLWPSEESSANRTSPTVNLFAYDYAQRCHVPGAVSSAGRS